MLLIVCLTHKDVSNFKMGAELVKHQWLEHIREGCTIIPLKVPLDSQHEVERCWPPADEEIISFFLRELGVHVALLGTLFSVREPERDVSLRNVGWTCFLVVVLKGWTDARRTAASLWWSRSWNARRHEHVSIYRCTWYDTACKRVGVHLQVFLQLSYSRYERASDMKESNSNEVSVVALMW